MYVENKKICFRSYWGHYKREDRGAIEPGSFWFLGTKKTQVQLLDFNWSGTFIFLRHIMGYRKMEVLYVFRHFFNRTF